MASAIAIAVGGVLLAPQAVAGTTAGPTTFLTGRVQDGAADVPGSSVVAYAWPNQAVLAAAGTKDFTLLPIARSATAADGSYTLGADLAALPSRYREPDGAVNLDVYVAGSPVAVTAAPTGSRAAMAGVDAVTPTHPGVVNLDRRASALSVQVAGRTTRTAAVHPASVPAPAAVRPDAAAQPRSCIVHTIATYVGRSEPFLHLYSSSDVPAYVTESTSSEHSLGVGISVSGSSWSAEGTATISTNSVSSLMHGFAHNWTVYNKVNYRRYGSTCITIGTGSTTYSQTVRPLGFYDVLTSADLIPAMNYAHCRTAVPGDVYTKTAGTNLTFTAGIKLGFFSANARAGYSRSTEVQWRVKHSGSQMCGNNTAWLNAQNAGAKYVVTGVGCAPMGVQRAEQNARRLPSRPC